MFDTEGLACQVPLQCKKLLGFFSLSQDAKSAGMPRGSHSTASPEASASDSMEVERVTSVRTMI